MSERDEPKSGAREVVRPLKLRHLALLWLGLSLAIIPAMAFVKYTEAEISKYHTLTFEQHVREALDAGNFSRALQIATGALKTSLKRSDHWGTVYLLRAKAYAGMEDWDDALAELRACARFWTKAYYYATEVDRREVESFADDLARGLLEAGSPERALQAFSLAAVGGARPVHYLRSLAATLSEPQRQALWGDARPYVVLEAFNEGEPPAIAAWADEQKRTVTAAGMDRDESQDGGASAYADLGPSQSGGSGWYGVPVYLPLSEERHALRVIAKGRDTTEIRVVLGYYFEFAHTSAATQDGPTAQLQGGWQRFDIERDFYQERLAYANQQNYTISGGVINRVGLSVPQGTADRVWIDRIELVLP